MLHFIETFAFKTNKIRRALYRICRNGLVIIFVGIFLLCSNVYFMLQSNAHAKQVNLLNLQAFRNELSEGKACGLLTSKEASVLIGQDISVSGSIIPVTSQVSKNKPGNPRIDSCAYSGLKSSDGYIDIVFKYYYDGQVASESYDKDLPHFYEYTSEDPEGFGQKLLYGDGLFYLLKGNLTLELSASYSPRKADVDTKELNRTILRAIVNKL